MPRTMAKMLLLTITTMMTTLLTTVNATAEFRSLAERMTECFFSIVAFTTRVRQGFSGPAKYCCIGEMQLGEPPDHAITA